MSDTVAVALITFFAGFAGSIIGAIATYKKAKLFAPPHIQEAMKATWDAISTALRDKRLPANSKDFDTLADAMQKDLYSFNAGEGKKPRFRKKK